MIVAGIIYVLVSVTAALTVDTSTLADSDAALLEVAEAFRAKAVEFDSVLKMGRTQLQDAVPMTLGWLVSNALLAPVRRLPWVASQIPLPSDIFTLSVSRPHTRFPRSISQDNILSIEHGAVSRFGF